MEISSKVRVSDLLSAESVPADAEFAFHLSDDLYQSRRISYADLSAQIRNTMFSELSGNLTSWTKTYVDEQFSNINANIRKLSDDLSVLSVYFHNHLSGDFTTLCAGVQQNYDNLRQISGYVCMSCVPVIIKIANCQLDVKGTLSAISTDLSVSII